MCVAVSVVTPQWIKEVLASYQDDPAALSMLTKLSIDPTVVPNFTLVDGILKFKNRIWVGADVSLQNKLLAACHSSALGGHSEVPVTYMRMKKLFAWKGMKYAVHQFVTSCLTCQQAKPDRSKLPGLLQPLEVPTQAWQIISLDLVEGLPMSGHANCILVVIDSFTKYGHFLLLHHPFTAASVAKLFMNNVYRLHGLPSAIVLDRDRIFTSKFWSELFRLGDVSLQLSSSYHPQSDGQTERLNQTMETFLRCFANACPSKWVEWIALAEYWYNNCFHSAINRSQFEALYGYAPKHFGIQPADAVQHTDLASWIQDRMVMTSLIKLHLTRSKDRMKRQADKKRSKRVFAVGDMVFLKLQPYIQSSLAPRSNQKLAFKFFGPFEVIARVGPVAYKLRLPASSSIHPSATTAANATAHWYQPAPQPPPPLRRPSLCGGGGGGCGPTRTFMESTTPLLLEMVMLRMLGEIRSYILPLPVPSRRELRLRRPRVPATATVAAATRRWHWQRHANRSGTSG
jgi:hypothetical protein